MLEAFRAHLNESKLVPEGARVLVGYSGGADSTCLVHLMALCGIDIVAAHLHHGQRAEADGEVARCEAFCKSLSIPFLSGRADVPLIAKRQKIGLEEAGRHARYEFFRQAVKTAQCHLIATAHTLDDHVETVILNLARGSGLRGLGGISAQRDGIIRPLLPFCRAETRAYCETNGLWFHDDPANEDPVFARARVRHRVMPELELINPAVRESMCRLADIAREEDALLSGAAAAALERCEVPMNGSIRFLTLDLEAWFDRAKLRHLPRALLRRGLRLALDAVGGFLDYDQADLAATAILGQASGSVTAQGGKAVVEWQAELVAARSLASEDPFLFELVAPGETISEDGGWCFTTREVPPSEHKRKRGDLEAVIDGAAPRGRLQIRQAKEGDEIRPLNMKGAKKLAAILGDAKLTHAARCRLPIVCDGDGPLWAPGLALADRAKVTPTTRLALLIAFGPNPN